jgi:ribose transport system substrate-binding protein
VEALRGGYPGIDFQVVHSADAASQEADLERLARWGMQVLVILPQDGAALAAPVRRLHDAGVRCVVLDRVLSDAAFGYVNIIEDAAALGRESAAHLAAAMKEEGLANYLVIGGDSLWKAAFFAEMDKEVSLVPVLGRASGEPDRGVAVAGVPALLARFPKVDAVYCRDDDVLMAVLAAVSTTGRADVRIVSGGRGSTAVLERILDGDPLVRSAALYPPALIAHGIEYAAALALDEKPSDFHNAASPLTVLIPTTLIDLSNAAPYYHPECPF